jgi:hypothetical protein
VLVEVVQAFLRGWVGHLARPCRGGRHRRARDEGPQALCGVGFASQDRADELDARQVRAGADGQAQRGVDVFGGVGRPFLPVPGQRGGVRERPGQVKDRGLRGGHGVKDQGGDDAEVASASAAERPEQVRVMARVACDHPAVRQDHLGPQQAVAGEPVSAPENPDPAAERQAGDPDRGPAASRDRDTVLEQRLV